MTREELAAQYGEVYDTKEMMDLFQVHSFLAPVVIVTRKADNVRGTLEFQHAPRYYFSFVAVE